MDSITFNKFHSRHVDIYPERIGRRKVCVECCLDFIESGSRLFSRKSQVLGELISVVERRSHDLIVKRLIVVLGSQRDEELTKTCFTTFERIVRENPASIRKNNVNQIFEMVKQKRNLPSMIHLIGVVVGNENLIRLVSKNYKNEIVCLVSDNIQHTREDVRGEVVFEIKEIMLVFIFFSISDHFCVVRRILEVVTPKGVSVFQELLDHLKSSTNTALQLNVLSTLALSLDYGMVSFFASDSYPEALVGVILSSDTNVQLGTLRLLQRSLQMDYLGQLIARSHIPDFLFEVLSQARRNQSSTNPQIPVHFLECMKLLLPHNVFLSPLLSHGISIILSHLPSEQDRRLTDAYIDFLYSLNQYLLTLNNPVSIRTLGKIHEKRISDVLTWCGDRVNSTETLQFVSMVCDYTASFFSIYGVKESDEVVVKKKKKKKKKLDYFDTNPLKEEERKEENVKLVIKFLLCVLTKLQRLRTDDFVVLKAYLGLLCSLPLEMVNHTQLHNLRTDVARRIVIPFTLRYHLERSVMDDRYCESFIHFLQSIVIQILQNDPKENQVEFGSYLCHKGVVSVFLDIGEQTELESVFHETRALVSLWIGLFVPGIVPQNVHQMARSSLPKLPRKTEDLLRVFYEDDTKNQVTLVCILHILVYVDNRMKRISDQLSQRRKTNIHPQHRIIRMEDTNSTSSVSVMFSRKKILRALDHLIHRSGQKLTQTIGNLMIIWILEIVVSQKKEKVSESLVRHISSLLMSHWRAVNLGSDHQYILEWILEYGGETVRPFAVGLLSKMWEDHRSSSTPTRSDEGFKMRFSKMLSSPGVYSQLLMKARTDLEFLSLLASLINGMAWVGGLRKESSACTEEEKSSKKEFLARLNSVMLCLMTMERKEGYGECMKNVLGIIHCLHPSDILFFSSHLVKLLGSSLVPSPNQSKKSDCYACLLYTLVVKMMSYVIFFTSMDNNNNGTHEIQTNHNNNNNNSETTRIRNMMLQIVVSEKIKKRMTEIIYPPELTAEDLQRNDQNIRERIVLEESKREFEEDVLLLLLQVTLTLVRFGGQVFAPPLSLSDFYILLSSRSALIRSLTCVLFRVYLQIFPFHLSSESQKSFLVFKLQNCLVRDDDEMEIIKGVVDCIEVVIQKFSNKQQQQKQQQNEKKCGHDDLFLWNEYLMEIGLKKGIWRGSVSWTGLRVFRMFCQYRVPKFIDRQEMTEFTKVLIRQFFSDMSIINSSSKNNNNNNNMKRRHRKLIDEDEYEDDEDDINVFEDIEVSTNDDDGEDQRRIGFEWLDKMKELLHVMMILMGYKFITDKELLTRIRVVVEECIHFMNFGFDLDTLKNDPSIFYLREDVIFVKDLLFRETSRDEEGVKLLITEFLGVCNQVVWNIKHI